MRRLTAYSDQRGYTLYLVFLVLIIAGILFSVSIRHAATVQIQTIDAMHRLQARCLAQSGIARTEFFFNGGDGHDMQWETEQFTEHPALQGTIVISCLRFGGFSRIISSGIQAACTSRITALAGRDLPQILHPALTLSGPAGSLVLDHASSLSGQLVIDHGAVKHGDNRRILAGYQSWTVTRQSPALPFSVRPLELFFARCHALLESVATDTTVRTIGVIDSATLASLPGSRSQRMLVVKGDCRLGAASCRNLRLICDGTVQVTASVVCEDVTIIARRIELHGGESRHALFYGRTGVRILGGAHESQFLADDSVSVSSTSRCSGLSLLAVRRCARGDSALSGGVIVGQGAVFEGHVICYTDSLVAGTVRMTGGASISIGPHSFLRGCVITDGTVRMQQVRIEGHVWAEALNAVDKKGVECTNFLIESSLTAGSGLPPFPLLGDPPTRVRLVKSRV